MSGHSHWAGIKHKKAANDAKKGKVFSRLAKLVYIAVREGGSGNPDDNPRLRLIVDKCRLANMPKDNWKRAIDKALDTSTGYTPMTFEAYGQGGAAVIIECLTDNTNRTGPEIRNLVEKCGAKLAKEGAVSYLFQRQGVFTVNAEKATEDQLMEVALEAGAEDIVDQGDFFEVYTSPNAFAAVGEALAKAGIETEEAEVKLIAENSVEVGLNDARKLTNLIDKLDEHEDVQNVYANFDVSDEVAKQLEA
ncbi:putative transcriptional regulatory protein [Planctomycetales bacterium]|nr:putative transcriptional regulatory protein [Planctomycetales bacterium]GHT02487.1 putative transcriptional regulatory protein [Planctomycetales bacterium]GHV20155.1 putative transcriptional regulatory protein [Planctomycetales bacterium]